MNLEKFHAERRKGIGGSDVAAIMGISRWKTAYQVWLDKLGKSAPTADNAAMMWGRNLEPIIRQHYCDITGRAVHVQEQAYVSNEYKFAIAHLDGMTEDGRILEIKTARTGERFGEAGTDEVPFEYLLQVQHYMLVTGADVADVAVLIGGQDFRIYEVRADKDLHKMIIRHEQSFWNHVTSQTPPAAMSVADAQAQFGSYSQDKQVIADDAIEKKVIEIKHIKQLISNLEADEDRLKAQIMSLIGDSDTLVTRDGKLLVTWKMSKGRTALNQSALKEKYPQIYQEFMCASEPTRRFLIK